MVKGKLNLLAQLQRDTQGEIPEHVKQKLKEDTAYELATLIESEQIEASPENIAELVEAWLLLLQRKAKEQGLRVQLSFARLKR